MTFRASFLRILCSNAVLPLGAATLSLAMPAMAAHHHKHPHHDGTSSAAVHQSAHKKHDAHPATTTTGKTHHHTAHHHASASHAAAVGATAGVAAGAAAATEAAPSPADAPPPPPDVPATDKGTNTGLPLPRFAAFRADKVYMRRGPGDRYPIDWVYHRRGLPVEIEREFDVWRLVEDSDGQKGWVHQATLYGSRTFVIPGLPPEGAAAQSGEASAQAGDHIGRADARILGTVATQSEARARTKDVMLMSHPEDDSTVVAVLQPGTVGNIKLCPQASQWCHVVVKGYDGWLPRRLFWGLLPGETIQPN